MRKINRIIMISVSVLLSLVLITSSVLSGTFAKYVTGEKSVSSNTGRAAKWGISVTTGDHLEKQYTEKVDGAFMVHTTGATDVIAPGTSGSLAWFRVCGAPEVAYGIDFSGSIGIGDGFKASSGLIRDENGDAIEYFPIQLRYVVYDVLSNGDLTEVTSLTSDQFCVQRTDKQDNQHYFNDGALENIAELTTVMNSSTDMGINNALDELYQAPNTSIDRIYAIEWKWLYHYDTTEEVAAGKTENNREATASGNYQTRELDTKLGEAILENPESFTITVDMSASIGQTISPSYQLFTENGVRKIEFGSYPQSDVTDDMGTTLNEIADNTDSWTSYGYNTGDMRYTDVTLDGEKYRGVYFTEARNTEQESNDYIPNSRYWFKYEPIKWTIIKRDTSEGKVLIFCDTIIDSQPYQSGDVPSGSYKNNYKLSTIRTWLNATFYNTAFSELQKQIITITEVVNNLASTGDAENVYICEDTQDNIFLLSYHEAYDYFGNLWPPRRKAPTAYAFSQGVWVNKTSSYLEYIGNGYWWLRSPNATKGNEVKVLNHGGGAVSDDVSYTENGVVPALWIKL